MNLILWWKRQKVKTIIFNTRQWHTNLSTRNIKFPKLGIIYKATKVYVLKTIVIFFFEKKGKTTLMTINIVKTITKINIVFKTYTFVALYMLY